MMNKKLKKLELEQKVLFLCGKKWYIGEITQITIVEYLKTYHGHWYETTSIEPVTAITYEVKYYDKALKQDQKIMLTRDKLYTPKEWKKLMHCSLNAAINLVNNQGD